MVIWSNNNNTTIRHNNFIDTKNKSGAIAAVKHLYEQGRRKIAFLSGPDDETNSLDRLRGYKDALKTQKELFQAKQTMTDIWIGVFVLVLLLNLLFKYFNIYGLIYNIIMNKK